MNKNEKINKLIYQYNSIDNNNNNSNNKSIRINKNQNILNKKKTKQLWIKLWLNQWILLIRI